MSQYCLTQFEIIRKDFSEHHQMQVPINDNHLHVGSMQRVGHATEQVENDYPENPGSHFVAQPVDNFLFPREKAGSDEKPNTIDKDDGIS